MEQDQAVLESCQVCGATRELALFLHKVRFGDTILVLCTNCLLKNHRAMFCPFCFDVYDDTPSPHLRLTCLKCPSMAHCCCIVGSSKFVTPIHDFQCPSCADTKFSYFDLDRYNPSINEAKNADGEGEPISVSAQKAQNAGAIDIESVKALVAAARIAASSMNKAGDAERIDAECRCKEAALAIKKVKKELEGLISMFAEESDASDDPNST